MNNIFPEICFGLLHDEKYCPTGKKGYLCGRMKGGAPARAEIIPYEPDPDSAGGGIGFRILYIRCTLFIWINR